MGFTPQQIGEMSLWQFTSIYVTYVKANSKEDNTVPDMSDEDIAQAGALIDSGPQWAT
jgi:hypothetical protein